MFREERANYPYIRDEDIGAYCARPFNKTKSKFIVNYTEPITKEFQEFNNRIAHYINQNFLIRLFSALQYYGIYKNFSKKNNPELAALKDYRNKFGHTLGKYNPGCKKDKKLMRDIIITFNFEDKEYFDFPTNIDTVINKIIAVAKKYIKEHYP